MKQKNKLQLILTSSVKTQGNKSAVDNAKETKININHESRNEFCFKKKNPFTMKKGYCFL